MKDSRSVFKPRDYQRKVVDSFINNKKNKHLCIWPRRAGKNFTGINLILQKALKEKGIYLFVFSTYQQVRHFLSSLTNEGNKIFDLIAKHESHSIELDFSYMTILQNGSVIKFCCIDNLEYILSNIKFICFDNLEDISNESSSLMPIKGIIFQDLEIYDLKTINLIAFNNKINNAPFIIFATPLCIGKLKDDLLYNLYSVVCESEDWFCEKIGINITRHIKDLDSILINNDLDFYERQLNCKLKDELEKGE